jgi:hypothetical protein
MATQLGSPQGAIINMPLLKKEIGFRTKDSDVSLLFCQPNILTHAYFQMWENSVFFTNPFLSVAMLFMTN